MTACGDEGLRQERVKWLDCSVEQEKIHEAIRIAKANGVASYRGWKEALTPPIRDLALARLACVQGPCVLHFDDVHTLMGEKVMTGKVG